MAEMKAPERRGDKHDQIQLGSEGLRRLPAVDSAFYGPKAVCMSKSRVSRIGRPSAIRRRCRRRRWQAGNVALSWEGVLSSVNSLELLQIAANRKEPS